MSADENRSLKQELEATRDELRRVADEIRVKAHLAGMDAKDAWAQLQPRLDDYERRIEAVGQDVASELRDIGRDLRQQLDKLRERLG